MNILMVDKFYFIKGGAERYLFELKEVLEAHGHRVIPFSMKHPRNFPTPYSEYFVDHIDFNPTSRKDKLFTGIRSIGRILYSTQARRRLRRLIRATRPDVAHLHMIDHQISPSILSVLKKEGIPVVQTIHTYKHVCPSYRLYNMEKGVICERCLKGSYYRAFFEKCHKDSFLSTSLLVLEMYVHRWLMLYQKYLDLYLVPSRFMGQKLVEGGIDPQKVRHLLYTVRVEDYPPRFDSDGYFLYYGRLSEEKGLLTLMKAMEGVSESRLRIAGEGPYRPALEAYAGERGLDRVEFVGALGGDALKAMVTGAQFVVVPSEWYENSPLVIYESFSMGKPVVGARIGGISELIEHGVDGFLFEAGNVQELRKRINHLVKHTKECSKMGRAARRKAEKEFDFHSHYPRIMEIYSTLVENQRES